MRNSKLFILMVAIMLSAGPAAMLARELPNSLRVINVYGLKPVPVMFRVNTDISTCAVPEQPARWGMDTAWDSADNVTRGTNYIGKDVMKTGRVSFQPSDLVGDDLTLSSAQKSALQSRLNHIAISGVKDIILNCDHEKLNKTNYLHKPEQWYRLIKATILYCKSKGYNVTTVSPFNEPDYTGWGEGSMADFKEIARLITEDASLAGIRISAGNTLNCDEALSWYNYMKPYVSEGNTHQLAGSFNTYANFWQTVRKDGNYTSADEMHNVGEALIGVHYGLQSGVWWGYEAAARGEFCRASYYGREIGYGEDRDAWSGAAVYKRQDGRIDAFLGVSERQAHTSWYEFINTDRPAYYDGHGPLYNYFMEMPGGTGYQSSDQCNAERMIQINYGEDVPVEPIDSGLYVIMSVGTKKVMSLNGGSYTEGTSINLGSYLTGKIKDYHIWNIMPVEARHGGDFGYYYIGTKNKPKQRVDLWNWSTSAGGTISLFSGSGGSNELWMFEYAGNGNWYIRSKHSGLYLEASSSNINQRAFTGSVNQQWRLMPPDADRDLTPPSAPAGLKATPQSASILLTWDANGDEDCVAYQLLRAPKGTEDWDVIGRMIDTTAFLDNSLACAREYIYKVQAVDRSRNRSEASAAIEAATAPEPALVARYGFNESIADETENHLDILSWGDVKYSTAIRKEGTHSISLSSKSENYMLLPRSVADNRHMTIATWVRNLSSTVPDVHIFDFGNGSNQHMYLTLNDGNNMCFSINDGNEVQTLKAEKVTSGTHHLALAIGEDAVTLYVDGKSVAQTSSITLRPDALHPVLNYVGRSQNAAGQLFNGMLDDLRIYNYALTETDVNALCNGNEPDGISETVVSDSSVRTHAVYDVAGRRVTEKSVGTGLYIVKGKKIYVK